MTIEEAKEPIKIYLDDQEEPFKTDYPPLRFSFSTIHLADGAHKLRVEASNGLAPPTIKEIPFNVRNGVALTVSGLNPNQTIGGQVELIINAYAGNTEVDFEPRRAETPQPIPTWAWVLLLGIIAWTLFYVLNPANPVEDATATVLDIEPVVGERLYMDTCARCHGEDGAGRRDPDVAQNYLVKKLRDTPNLAIAELPYRLLFKIVTGVRSSGSPDKPVRMPAWGPRFTNEEIVAVTNYVRSAWGHDASQILPRYRRPPAGIDELEEDLLNAMVTKDAAAMEGCCWPERVRPELYRIDGPRWAVGRDDVAAEWRGYFEALGSGEILEFQLTDVRYDYDPATVETIGSRVFAMGRIFISSRSFTGQVESETGRFIRVYERVEEPLLPADPRAAPSDPIRVPEWALIFDFASIRMRVGCDPTAEPDCPPGEVPGVPPTRATAEGIGYAEVQGFFRALKRDTGDAPHERFWEQPYKEFLAFEFPVSWDDVDDLVPLLVVGDSRASNLIKALRDGKGIKVNTARGKVITKNIQKMPKGAAMPDENVAKIAAWIDAGCPEFPDDKGGSAGGGTPRDPGTVVPPDQAIGFEDVRRIFRALQRQVGDAPHEVFWELPYEEFVQWQFPFSWDDVEEEVQLLVPWNSAESNLITALTGGRGIKVVKGGRVIRKTIATMPKGGKPMSAADVAKLAAWIDAGCPREPGGPSPWPKPGEAPPPKDEPAPPDEGPKDEPADEPKEPAAAPKAPPPEEPKTAAIGFAEVKAIFKALRQKAPQAPHSNFWKELSYAEFVTFEFPEGPGKPGMVRLLVPWNSAASNMVKALTDGKGVEVRYLDGRVVARDIPPMPKDADPMPKADLDKLRAWIDAGCPEVAGKPAALPKPK